MEIPESKWIDKYLLRYGPPSVFGAFLLAFLYHKRQSFGLNLNLHLDRLELASIFLFGGFLLAYLASAPVLALHFSRCVFLPKRHKKKVRIISILSFITLFALAHCFFLYFWKLDAGLAYFSAWAFATWSQSAWPVFVAANKREEVYEFYSQLAEKRVPGRSEFIESYRTLREHGNAFFIIYWEIMLMIVLLTGMRIYTIAGKDVEDALSFALVICLIWITPAVMSWHFAGYLESDMIEDKKT